MKRLPSATAVVLSCLAASAALAATGAGTVVRVVSPPFSGDYAASRSLGPAAAVTLSGTVDGNPSAPPDRCYPNPFNPRTTLGFDLCRPGRVRLDVYDAGGRHVASLVDEPLAAGRHVADWTGRGEGGRSVPSGVYFARFVTETVSETRRMLLLR
ncbi:T9SS type A sorting domain-containing protein [bacterium]|nr:T9SS type A sorting domain-containing protein [bacterium]MBU1677221.1 T9SS type A sorting domain-containing protein [bacterium]